MGDMADFLLMSQDPYWYGDGPDDWSGDNPVECRYCGRGDLEWTHTQKGWRLMEPQTGGVHCCDAYRKKVAVEGFKPI